MTVPEIYAAELEVLGVADPADASDAAKARCLIDINAAIQQMQDAGEDFYGREELVVTLVSGTEDYTLAKDVQSVLDPVALSDGSTLRKLTTRGQLLSYGPIFAGQLATTVPSGKPVAYYVESLFDPADEEDNVTIKLHLRPAPDSTNAGLQLLLGVIKDATMITADDLEDEDVKIPVPHRYVESIFLPLVRWNATSSYLFTQKDMLDRYREDYDRALKLLGKADPRATSKPGESNTQALKPAQPVAQAA